MLVLLTPVSSDVRRCSSVIQCPRGGYMAVSAVARVVRVDSEQSEASPRQQTSKQARWGSIVVGPRGRAELVRGDRVGE